MSNFEIISTRIGQTPLINLGTYNNINLFGKLEAVNPTGSIKDRAAFNMLRRAFEQSIISFGDTIVESTSGNTGISLAYIGRELGFKVILTMPANMSNERVELLKKYGAEVILTDERLGMQGATDKAREIALNGAFMPQQFENIYNKDIHTLTTAPEIFREYPSVNYIICPLGSGGTAMGIKEYILANGFSAKVIAVEPHNSQVLKGKKAAAHKIQGIGANFVPSIVNLKMLDGICAVTDEDAYICTKALKANHNLFCGITSGAAYSAALTLAAGGLSGDMVIILPDSGDRYYSTGVFDE